MLAQKSSIYLSHNYFVSLLYAGCSILLNSCFWSKNLLIGWERSFYLFPNKLSFPSYFASAAAQVLEALAVWDWAEGGKRAAPLAACCLGTLQVRPLPSPYTLQTPIMTDSLFSRSDHLPFYELQQIHKDLAVSQWFLSLHFPFWLIRGEIRWGCSYWFLTTVT